MQYEINYIDTLRGLLSLRKQDKNSSGQLAVSIHPLDCNYENILIVVHVSDFFIILKMLIRTDPCTWKVEGEKVVKGVKLASHPN